MKKNFEIETCTNLSGDEDVMTLIQAHKDGSVLVYMPASFFDGDSTDYVYIDPETKEEITEFEGGLKKISADLRERKKAGKNWMQ